MEAANSSLKNAFKALFTGGASVGFGLAVGWGVGGTLMRVVPIAGPQSVVQASKPKSPTAEIAVAKRPGNALEGHKVFNAHCLACHGEAGAGKIGLAPSIGNPNFLALASDDFIKATVQAGRKGTAMIARPDLAGQPLTDLITYLRSQPVSLPTQIKVDNTLKFDGDALAGGEKYGTYCASCHGAHGQGYAEGGVGPGIGMSGFLQVASDDFIYETLQHGRAGTAMRPFLGSRGLANLSPRDAHDIIAYLRTLQGRSPAAGDLASMESSEPDATIGKDIFMANCAACHQPEGQGSPGLAPSIRNRDFLALASDGFIRDTIRKGRPGTAMVARHDLAGPKSGHLIAYLRSLEVAVPLVVQVDPDRQVSGDHAAGAEKYQIYCASCHGAEGEGYAAGGAGPGIGLQGFLNVASDDYIFQTVKHGRTGTAMRPFMGSRGLANLSESDVGDIIAHLRRR